MLAAPSNALSTMFLRSSFRSVMADIFNLKKIFSKKPLLPNFCHYPKNWTAPFFFGGGGCSPQARTPMRRRIVFDSSQNNDVCACVMWLDDWPSLRGSSASLQDYGARPRDSVRGRREIRCSWWSVQSPDSTHSVLLDTVFYARCCRTVYSYSYLFYPLAGKVIFTSCHFMSCNFMPCNFDGPSFSCPSFSVPPVI